VYGAPRACREPVVYDNLLSTLVMYSSIGTFNAKHGWNYASKPLSLAVRVVRSKFGLASAPYYCGADAFCCMLVWRTITASASGIQYPCIDTPHKVDRHAMDVGWSSSFSRVVLEAPGLDMPPTTMTTNMFGYSIWTWQEQSEL